MFIFIKKCVIRLKASIGWLNPFRFYKYFFNLYGQASGSSDYRKYFVPKKVYFQETEKPRIDLIAFYLPQFHPIPENDLWWGEGFTEWTNVSKAVPQFLGHYQPHLPGELGFYDLRVEENLVKQVELAKIYGLSAFCFYFYWFNGKTLLELPIKQILNNKDINFKYCLCWANENWTRRWDGNEEEILIAQNHSHSDDISFIEYVSKYLKDKRYYRIFNKPVLLVYRPSLLPDPAETASRWRKWCLSNGVGEIYLVSVQSFEKCNPFDIGFDAATEFPPGQAKIPNIVRKLDVVNPEFDGKVFNYRDLAAAFMNRQEDEYPLFKAVCPGWDNEARRTGRGRVFHNSTPQLYREWLQRACEITLKKNLDGNLLFVNAWNEWAEGAHLEPDRKFGYAYLEATAEALKKFQNQ